MRGSQRFPKKLDDTGCLAGYEGMKEREAKIPAQGKVRLTEAVQRLVELYDAWGKKDQADKWRQRLAEMSKGTDVEKKK